MFVSRKIVEIKCDGGNNGEGKPLFKSQTKWNGLFYCFIMMLGINRNVALVVVVVEGKQ